MMKGSATTRIVCPVVILIPRERTVPHRAEPRCDDARSARHRPVCRVLLPSLLGFHLGELLVQRTFDMGQTGLVEILEQEAIDRSKRSREYLAKVIRDGTLFRY